MSKPPIDGDAVIPSDWDGSYCQFAVCWPSSPQWLAILRGQLEEPAQGRFYRASTGNIIAAQVVIKETLDNNLHLQEVIMACNDASALASALNNIAAALAANGQTTQCCVGGSTGGGQFDVPPGGVDTGGSNPETDPPPTGYPSWGAYDQQRCGVATQIMEDVQQSLGNMVILIITGLSIEAIVELLIIGLTLTVSTAGLAAIAALLLTVGGTIICATALSLVNDNFADLVCALLSGSNSSTSRAAFIAKWGEIVDDAAIDPVEGFAIKQLMAYMVGNEEVNRMYTPNSSVDYSSYNCPGCSNELCTTFNDDELHGYGVAIVTGSGDSTIETFPVLGSIAGGSDAAVLTSEESGPSDYASIQSPTMEAHTIVLGDTICLNVTEDTTVGSLNIYIDYRIDGAWTQVLGVTSTPVGIFEYSLDAYEGQEISGWRVGYSRNGSFQVYVTTIGLNCSEC